MEFFSRNLTESESGERRSRYHRHVEMLELPPRLGDLALRELRHSRLRRIVVDRRTQQVILFLHRTPSASGSENGSGSDSDPDYGHAPIPAEVEILYHRVDLERLDAELLEARAADPETVILAGELDRLDGDRFLHRLLLHPEGEIELDFRDAACVERGP